MSRARKPPEFRSTVDIFVLVWVGSWCVFVVPDDLWPSHLLLHLLKEFKSVVKNDDSYVYFQPVRTSLVAVCCCRHNNQRHSTVKPPAPETKFNSNMAIALVTQRKKESWQIFIISRGTVAVTKIGRRGGVFAVVCPS